MPKNIDDMVLPERKRSIRNISVSDVRRKPVKSFKSEETETPPPPRETPPPLTRFKKKGPRKVFWAILGSAVLLTFVAFSLLGGAVLTYVPRSAQISFSGETFSAEKTGGILLYSVIKLSGDKGMAVAATGESEVSRKASGSIVVYNKSTTAQKLVENTRFESLDGKIYRIDKAITVPANGSVEAVVYADVAGPSYNVGLTDFTVPGLKGSSKYESVYARSKTPMAGGFVGKEKSIDPQVLAKAKTDLRALLSQELLTTAKAEVPTEFILFPSLSSITFEDLPQAESESSGNATINLRGNLYGIMFKRGELALALASAKLEVLAGEEVEFKPLDLLDVSFVGSVPSDLISANKINFKVSGSGKVFWRTDETALRSAVSGKEKREIDELLKSYSTIERATVTVKPFWKSSFPEDPSQITVKRLEDE